VALRPVRRRAEEGRFRWLGYNGVWPECQQDAEGQP